MVIALVLLAQLQPVACAKHKTQNEDQGETIPTAVITGLAGEQYVLYGTGGITVQQTPKPGMWHSNMRVYKVCIDGSNTGAGAGGSSQSGSFAASNFAAATVDSDFRAVGNTAYFVSNSAVCTLPSAAGLAGREIFVCNTSQAGTITYGTASGETVSGKASGVMTNSTPNKVDRFISDGKNWYAE